MNATEFETLLNSICEVKEIPKKRKLNLQEIFPTQTFINKNTNKYIIFSAQNNTEVDVDFLQAIKQYEKLDYQPICVPLVYQTLNPFSNQEQRDVWWDSRLNDYLINRSIQFNDNLALHPSIRPSATTLRPLAGLINRSKISLIVGANRQHVESIASPKGDMPTLFFSTGSVTVPNFRPGMAGSKAKPGHTIGALIVEIDGDRFYWRHIGWKDDCFYDLDRKVTKDGIESNNPIEAVIWGDFHAEDHSKTVWDATIELSKKLKPKHHVLHDLVTFKNGHHMTTFDRLRNSDRRTDEGFKTASEYLTKLQSEFPESKIVVVNSNHDNHLDGWLERYKHKEFPQDALFYHKLMTNILLDQDGREPFYHAMKMNTPRTTFEKIRWLKKAESFIINNHELGNHGHSGTNGSRGSLASLQRTTKRQLIGHSHIIGRNDNVTQAGTSAILDEDFHTGYSACIYSHILLYPNGTNTHVVIHNNGKIST